MRQPTPVSVRLEQAPVLAAALGVFERMGYARARVEDILEAAGIARRTFYKRFKSKEDVLVALYTAATGDILAALGELPTDERDPLASIHQAVDVYLAYHEHNAGTLRVLIGESMRPDSPLYEMRKGFRGALVRILADVARRRNKDFSPFVFVALVSALEGLSLELLEASSVRGARSKDLEAVRQTTHALLAKVFDVKGPAFPR